MKKIFIRPSIPEDAPELYAMRILPGVQENILALPSSSFQQTLNFIQSLGDNDHMLVAELDNGTESRIIGSGCLHVDGCGRLRHCGEIALSIHPQHQGKGAGRKLIESLLDLADNWLMLVRVELNVFCDNSVAIDLYKSCGFVIEGTRKYAAIKDGNHADLYLMARYHLQSS